MFSLKFNPSILNTATAPIIGLDRRRRSGKDAARACGQLPNREAYLEDINKHMRSLSARRSLKTQTPLAVTENMMKSMISHSTNRKRLNYGGKIFHPAYRSMVSAKSGKRKSAAMNEIDEFQPYEDSLMIASQLAPSLNFPMAVKLEAANAPAFLQSLKKDCDERGLIWTPETGKINSVLNTSGDIGSTCAMIETLDGTRSDHRLKGEGSTHIARPTVDGAGAIQPDLLASFCSTNTSVNMAARFNFVCEPPIDADDRFSGLCGSVHYLDIATVLNYAYMITHYEGAENATSVNELENCSPLECIDIKLEESDYVRDLKQANMKMVLKGCPLQTEHVVHGANGEVRLTRVGAFSRSKEDTHEFFVRENLWDPENKYPDGYPSDDAFDLMFDSMKIFSAYAHKASKTHEDYESFFDKAMNDTMNIVSANWSVELFINVLRKYLTDNEYRNSWLWKYSFTSVVFATLHGKGGYYSFNVSGRRGVEEEPETFQEYRVRMKPWTEEYEQDGDLFVPKVFSNLNDLDRLRNVPNFTSSTDNLNQDVVVDENFNAVAQSETDPRLIQYLTWCTDVSFSEPHLWELDWETVCNISHSVVKASLNQFELFLSDKIIIRSLQSDYFPFSDESNPNIHTGVNSDESIGTSSKTPMKVASMVHKLLDKYPQGVMTSKLDVDPVKENQRRLEPYVAAGLITPAGKSRFCALPVPDLNTPQKTLLSNLSDVSAKHQRLKKRQRLEGIWPKPVEELEPPNKRLRFDDSHGRAAAELQNRFMPPNFGLPFQGNSLPPIPSPSSVAEPATNARALQRSARRGRFGF